MKEVGIAEFKAHLSRYIRQARAGGGVVVTDRGTPVARLVAPEAGLIVRKANGRLRDLKEPPPNDVDFDVVERFMAEERRRDPSWLPI
ncbi:MAG TPA: type II toxin-antitoxin system prevent-host-death family antitoxin [Terriglobales bacterium]|nr:type II toxin-antitoxin system prevent-host-death family antitoxin [Terriglobales bacterium]